MTDDKTPIIPLTAHEKLVHPLPIDPPPRLWQGRDSQRHDTRIRRQQMRLMSRRRPATEPTLRMLEREDGLGCTATHGRVEGDAEEVEAVEGPVGEPGSRCVE